MKDVLPVVSRHPVLTLLVFSWLAVLCLQAELSELLQNYAGFGLLGVVGAVFANATGAGGGVVFVPFFNQLGFEPASIIATSFAIQCCGMTAGAVTWWRYFRGNHRTDPQWQELGNGLLLTIPASLTGIWLAQYGASGIPVLSALKGNLDHLHLGFGLFSILLALAIFASIPLLKRSQFRQTGELRDTLCLPIVAFVGGIVTAWLSVGVGEMVAVYLIIRGFNVALAIAMAVILSAFSVWGAIAYHVLISQAIVWPVVLFAGAGAVVGGILAKRVVLAFSPVRLKMFFGTWVLLLGASGLPVF